MSKPAVVTPRLLERYRTDISSEMMKLFNYTNKLQVPKLKKIVLNVGLGEATKTSPSESFAPTVGGSDVQPQLGRRM